MSSLFIIHEVNQNDKIQQLQDDINEIKEEYYSCSIKWENDDFNYLAIGNSITCHPINEYWWNECGMAATKKENDYVHNLSALLQSIKEENVVAKAFNFSAWEFQNLDRSETLINLDSILSDKIDLITIQLSENATDLGTFESDFEELIRYVQKNAPNADIIVIGDFWDERKKDILKQDATNNCGVIFVSLDEIKWEPQYMCGLETLVYDEYDNPHIVEHDGVAAHPNDEAMKWIAKKIFELYMNSYVK